MKAIRLTQAAAAKPKTSVVKRTALSVFKTVRAVAEQGKSVPAQITRSLNDVRDAWTETRPNVERG